MVINKIINRQGIQLFAITIRRFVYNSYSAEIIIGKQVHPNKSQVHPEKSNSKWIKKEQSDLYVSQQLTIINFVYELFYQAYQGTFEN